MTAVIILSRRNSTCVGKETVQAGSSVPRSSRFGGNQFEPVWLFGRRGFGPALQLGTNELTSSLSPRLRFRVANVNMK